MDKDISTQIVKDIISDIYCRSGLEQYFRSLHPEIQVEMYEKWIELVSKRLHEKGLIEEEYMPLKINEMSFVEIVNRSSYYIRNE